MAFHRPASDGWARYIEEGSSDWNDIDRARAKRDAAPFLASATESADWWVGPKTDDWYTPEDETAADRATAWGISLAENELVPAFGLKCDGDRAMGVLWAILSALADHAMFSRDEALLRAAHGGCGFHLSRRAIEFEEENAVRQAVRERDRRAQAQLALRRRVTDPRRGPR